jgi:Arc/MetJ family transcription regulator
MKRTNVILDETLLEEAVRRSGEKTYSATINRALQELVRRLTLEEGLNAISGTGWWEGDLAEMRRGREFDFPDEIRDAPVVLGKPKRKRRRRGSR